MRIVNKYKKIPKLDRFSYPQFPLRILRFQRPKWKKFQKSALNFQKSNCTFVNPLTLKLSYKQWEKVQNYYKAGIQIKRKIIALFDDSIKITCVRKNLLKKTKLNNNIFLSTLVKPEFRLDILLWRLCLFSSSFSARQSINNKQITVNNKFVAGNFFLKKGDIISFDSESFLKINLSSNFSRIYTQQKYCTFVEVDVYSQTLVVVKDLKDLTSDDFNFFINEYVDLKKFRDYI